MSSFIKLSFRFLLNYLLFSFFYQSKILCDLDSSSYSVKCDDEDDTKLNHVCALITSKSDEGADKEQLYVFDNCGRGEKCVKSEQDEKVFVCKKDVKLRGFGEYCNYNEDCISGVCAFSKCKGIQIGNTCQKDGIQKCTLGAYCNEKTNVCTRYSKENAECSEDSQCEFGYSCYSLNQIEESNGDSTGGSEGGSTDDSQSERKGICRKWGTIVDDSLNNGDEKLCVSGITLKNKCNYPTGIESCVENKNENKNEAKVTWKNGGSSQEECTSLKLKNGTIISVPKRFNNNTRTYWRQFLNEFNLLDYEDLIEDKEYYIPSNKEEYYKIKLDWDVYKKYLQVVTFIIFPFH